MSYDDRKSQRLRKRRVRSIFFISIFFLMLARTAYGIIVKSPRTVLVREEEFIVSLDAQSILIMDEKVYELSEYIVLNPSIVEGKRVSQGLEVGKSDNSKDIYSLNNELKEIDEAIDLLNKGSGGSDFFVKDKIDIELAQETLIDEIKAKLSDDDFSAIDKIKTQMVSNNNKLSDLPMNNTLLGENIESLNSRRDLIVNSINNNDNRYFTQEAGLISFKVDGFENLYVPKEFENYTYENLDILGKGNLKAQGKTGTSISNYKIIKNFDWYLAIKIDSKKDLKSKSYEVNDTVYLKIEDNSRELAGRIVAINESDDKSVFILKFNSYLHDYYDRRYPKVEIELSKQDVYLIPTKSILDKDGQAGVYIKEFNGIVRFRPIEIIATKGNNTIISKGDENKNIQLKGDNFVRTIFLYDEILLNPAKFKEGEILD